MVKAGTKGRQALKHDFRKHNSTTSGQDLLRDLHTAFTEAFHLIYTMKCGILSAAPLRANDFLVFATDGNSIPFCLYPNIFSRLERTCPIPVRARQTGRLPSVLLSSCSTGAASIPCCRNVSGRPQTLFAPFTAGGSAMLKYIIYFKNVFTQKINA